MSFELLQALGMLSLLFAGFLVCLAAAALIGIKAGLFTLNFRRITRFFNSRLGQISLAALSLSLALSAWFVPFTGGLPLALSSLLTLGYLVFWLNGPEGGYRARARQNTVDSRSLPAMAEMALAPTPA